MFRLESGESSSSDDENLSDNNNSPAALSKINGNQETSSANGRSTQNERNDSSVNFPIPSTSTGITGNGKITIRFFSIVQNVDVHLYQCLFAFWSGANFRIVQTPDSDDEPTPDSSPVSQSVSQAPATKVNGVHSTNTAPYSSGVDDDQPSERNSRRKRHHSLTTTNYHFTNYSSHSSSDDDDDTSSDDSSIPFFSNHLNKRTKQMENNESTTSQTSLLRLERTPSRSRDQKDYEITTPDSGIGTTPGSSTSR